MEERPEDLVPHPFPAKGTRKVVKRNYREYLIEQASASGSKAVPVSIDTKVTKKETRLVEQLTTESGSQDKTAREIIVEAERAELNRAIKTVSGSRIKPPKNWVEARFSTTAEGYSQMKALSRKKEKGETRIEWKYFTMDYHVYWLHKNCSV